MRFRGFVAAAVVTVAASGCWLQSGFGPDKTANNAGEAKITAANVAGLTQAWTASTGSQFAREAVIHAGVAYVRSDGRMSAFDLRTGATRWSVVVGNSAGSGRSVEVPAMVDGALHLPFSGLACGMATIDPADGTVTNIRHFTWAADPGRGTSLCSSADALATGTIVAAPVQGAGIDIGACPDGTDLHWATVTVATVDVTGGRSYGAPPGASGAQCGSPPLVDFTPFQALSAAGDEYLVGRGETLVGYVQQCDGFLCNPAEIWTVDVGGEITGPPLALRNGDVAVARTDGQLVVVDGQNHLVKWTAVVGAHGGQLAANDTTVFAVATDSNAIRTLVAAVPADGCGAATCTPTWTASMFPTSSGRPSIAGDVLYVTSGRTLHAFDTGGCDATTCTPLWSASAAVSGGLSSPAIYDGVVVVGSSNGTVVAYALPAVRFGRG